MTRLAPTLTSLHGLALGDAFGETWFFKPADQVERLIAARAAADGHWPWTDDTAMALVLTRMLIDQGEVDQDTLATAFAAEYEADPYRNYGPSMHGVLRAIHEGEHWPSVTARQFDGQGSWGNGAAMRVAPLGVWFAADLDRVPAQAVLSAQVTHAHPEALAGAVAVAVAAALAVRGVAAGELLDAVAARTPDGEVAAGLRRVARLRFSLAPSWVAGEVGCGLRISAADTVPYAVWCAARHLDDLPEALWATASAGGDIDTTCAIVGGIIAARTGLGTVPASWLASREPLPAWTDPAAGTA
ncbi:ADP-ribosylglycohydrolase family protein [Catellatospora sp. KI3]|uniref:ADP-ribosylglycohydrolase family protein n=1 Tax=Catellatospora sp. KI3 TaxID=3041620 RepID=UPI00248305F3|nr:ADP-ribosylglycohydrolase family protein [Catellatospora sp. KI3]MDI1462083.1 ADP-ribosylglycohydrolase family protein [Catellatospora sp. KI3]